MITSDSFQHDEEHRRLSGGGSTVILPDTIRVMAAGSLTNGVNQAIQIGGANGIPLEARAVILWGQAVGVAASTQFIIFNPDQTSGNLSGRIAIPSANGLAQGTFIVALSKTGAITATASGGNLTNVYIDIIGYILQH